MTTETDIAYLAGIVDGEGCIRINKSPARGDRTTPSYSARLHIHMVDEGAIRFLAETLGGWYYKEKPHSAQGKPLFRYQVSDRAAENVITTLLPYLRVKREAALAVLQLRSLQREGAKHRTKVTGHRPFPTVPL